MKAYDPRSLSACAVVVLLAAVLLPTSGMAQPRPRGERASLDRGPLEYISMGDQRVIRKQVEVAISAAEMAVETLTGGTTVEELTQAEDLSAKSYVLLRYAMHGVEVIVNAEDRTPSERIMAQLALNAINEAREYNLEARRALQNSIPWPETREQYAEEAIQGLTESIPAAQRAVRFIFR
jgi:hypothetical protein